MTDDVDLTEQALAALRAAGGLMTTQEIATEWGMTRQAIAYRVAAGTFPDPVKVAGHVRLYLRSQIDPLRDERQPPPAAPGVLGLSEASQLAEVSSSTLRRAIAAGELAAESYRPLRLRAADVRRWRAARARPRG